jgi:hypothetical protein
MIKAKILKLYIKEYPNSKMALKYKTDKLGFLYFSENELDELVVNSTKTKILEYFKEKENLDEYELEFITNYQAMF